MAEYVKADPKAVAPGETVLSENRCESPVEIAAGVVFRGDGDYIVSVRDGVIRVRNHDTTRWIPVTERLPERGRLVLTAIYGTDMIVQEDGESLEDAVRRARSGPGRVEMGYLDEDGYWTDTAFGAPMVVMPRYWMPLPEPPKNEEEESHENQT